MRLPSKLYVSNLGILLQCTERKASETPLSGGFFALAPDERVVHSARQARVGVPPHPHPPAPAGPRLNSGLPPANAGGFFFAKAREALARARSHTPMAASLLLPQPPSTLRTCAPVRTAARLRHEQRARWSRLGVQTFHEHAPVLYHGSADAGIGAFALGVVGERNTGLFGIQRVSTQAVFLAFCPQVAAFFAHNRADYAGGRPSVYAVQAHLRHTLDLSTRGLLHLQKRQWAGHPRAAAMITPAFQKLWERLDHLDEPGVYDWREHYSEKVAWSGDHLLMGPEKIWQMLDTSEFAHALRRRGYDSVVLDEPGLDSESEDENGYPLRSVAALLPERLHILSHSNAPRERRTDLS